jgi:hypothetical protein
LSLVACSDSGSGDDGNATPVADSVVNADGGITQNDGTSSDGTAAQDTTADSPVVADVTTEPDTTEPDTAEPDIVAEPDTTDPDVTEPDTTEPDVTEPDVTEPDIVTEPDTTEPSVLTAMITTPPSGETYEVGTTLSFKGVVTDSVYDASDLQVVWTLNGSEVLWEGAAALGGWSEVDHTFDVPGYHSVTLTVTNPDGDEQVADVSLGICTYGEVETFDQPLSGSDWAIYGDAYWDQGGWLEMTGNLQGKKGAIFNTVEGVNPGDVEIHFSIWTGGNVGTTGADGFTMSVVNAASVADLENFIATAANGGCLGYGVSGECGNMTLDAFHVEFDTYQNNGDVNYDPTSQNHIAVMLDGDASNHVLWVAQTLEDSQWHDVMIKTIGQQIIVTFDGNELINDNVNDFQFHGGFIGFTGVTGWGTNFHRFDNLQIVQNCMVP